MAILVVDDEARIRELLRKALEKKGYQVVTVPSVAQALDIVHREAFDCIILDVRLAGESGLSVLKDIRDHQSKVPVVVYSGALTEDLEKEARQAGANEVLSKTMELNHLIAQIERTARAKERLFSPVQPGDKTLLIVDDEKDVRELLDKFFVKRGYRTFEAANGAEAVEIAAREEIRTALVDMKMPGMDGLQTLEKLLAVRPGLGVVMVTGEQDDDKVRAALDLGACGYVLKPFDLFYIELVVASKLVIAGG